MTGLPSLAGYVVQRETGVAFARLLGSADLRKREAAHLPVESTSPTFNMGRASLSYRKSWVHRISMSSRFYLYDGGNLLLLVRFNRHVTCPESALIDLSYFRLDSGAKFVWVT